MLRFRVGSEVRVRNPKASLLLFLVPVIYLSPPLLFSFQTVVLIVQYAAAAATVVVVGAMK